MLKQIDNSDHTLNFPPKRDFDKRQKIETLLEEAWHLRTSSNLEGFFQNIDSANQLAKEINDTKAFAIIDFLKHLKVPLQKPSQEALSLLKNVENLLDFSDTHIWKLRVYVVTGDLLLSYHQTEQALVYGFKQLELAQKINDETHIAAAFYFIGCLYSFQNIDEKALDYFDKAEQLFSKVNDAYGITLTLVEISSTYRNKGHLTKAKEISKRCLDVSLSNKCTLGLAHAHIELGYLAEEEQDYSKAYVHFQESLKHTKAAGRKDLEAQNYLKLVDVSIHCNSAKTLTYLEKAKEASEFTDNKTILLDYFKSLADYHKHKNEYQKAFEALAQHLKLKEDYWQNISNKRFQNALVLFETEKAQRQAETHRLKSIELETTVSELEHLNKVVKELSIRDSLTGLYNRRHLEQQIYPLFEQAVRYKKAISICLLDIDNFKKINDNFSHQIGDEVLKSFSKLITDSIRSSDVAARFGGEEFIILMPETTLDNAHQFAERLRLKIESFDWSTIAEGLNVTSSFGLSSKDTAKPEEQHPEKLISIADTELYLAKDQGRNRVCSSCAI